MLTHTPSLIWHGSSSVSTWVKRQHTTPLSRLVVKTPLYRGGGSRVGFRANRVARYCRSLDNVQVYSPRPRGIVCGPIRDTIRTLIDMFDNSEPYQETQRWRPEEEFWIHGRRYRQYSV